MTTGTHAKSEPSRREEKGRVDAPGAGSDLILRRKGAAKSLRARTCRPRQAPSRGKARRATSLNPAQPTRASPAAAEGDYPLIFTRGAGQQI